ncbi:MAG: hypothetical protein AAGM21_10085 [Pseudomonadota bacterium]
MTKRSEVDWLGLSSQKRVEPTKQLYRILRDLHVTLGGRFEELFEQAQNAPLGETLDPYSNIKKGIYDRRKAQAIHEWLARNHFAFAHAKAPSLFQFQRVSDWERFIEAHKVEGGLRMIPAKQMGIARRSPPEDGAETFQLGQEYLFELTTTEPCHVVAFEGVNDSWHPLGLGQEDHILRLRVPSGISILPRASDDTLIPLAEYDQPGLHQFVFVLCSGPKPPTDRNSLIGFASSHQVIVCEKSVRFWA